MQGQALLSLVTVIGFVNNSIVNVTGLLKGKLVFINCR
jgi:hypothetical protein